jgi:dimethylhistidine N-methyltransferase
LPDAEPVQYRVVERLPASAGDERAEVVEALTARPPSIAPRYFYDELGCALYGAICELPEYYPTRVEAALFREHREEIAAAMGRGRQFVDLGAGDGRKAQAWLPFLAPARYVAVDIAAAELRRTLARMAPDFPGIEMVGVVTDFFGGVSLEQDLDLRPATFFYPGSSIGNFTPPQAVNFLRSIHAHVGRRPGSALLIGVDGKKDKARLDAAYDDALGVTAAFNRNALRHLNRRFGFDFDITGFSHLGFYEPGAGRIEMHLESLRDQSVGLGEVRREFARGERIHTESSYKYAPPEFEALLRQAGFGEVRRWDAPGDAYYAFYAA